MAFKAVFNNGNNIEWLLNKLTNAVLTDNEIDNIKYFSADGEELYYIKSQYSKYTDPTTEFSIPIPRNQDIVRWYGDIAKTIVFNL